jgi:mannose-6-phosphate isomerase-like protein (cupin superfamily)
MIMTEHSGAVPTGAGRGAVDIAQKFGRFTELWSPKIIAESNGWQFKLVKASGEFVWHQHDIDEVFLVFAGQITIQLRGADDVTLGPGQLFVVPRSTEPARMCPRAVS